jgi:hypothetical protein
MDQAEAKLRSQGPQQLQALRLQKDMLPHASFILTAFMEVAAASSGHQVLPAEYRLS